jgi:hypothetical protein
MKIFGYLFAVASNNITINQKKDNVIKAEMMSLNIVLAFLGGRFSFSWKSLARSI